jgi:molecular chaperone GrpE (heat shock protein)
MMRTAGETTAMQMRERSVADLSEQLRRLGELLSSITQREVEAREKISREMQEQARIQQEAASAEYKAKLDELEGKRKSTEADLDSKRQALERDKAAHETRESKYVRRDMEKKLAEVLKESERLELSAGTQKKRNVIHAFVAVMLLASGGLGVEMLRKVLAMSSADLHYLIPLGAATTLTFFSTLVYYLKWNDRWFREHAETELASKRYKADIVRAAWIAELTSE